MTHDFPRARERMIATQLRGRGIFHERVLAAFAEIPRHFFVDPALVDQAYADRSLPIGFGQTITQPFMVARMLELLDPQPDQRILEIGTGSGYQAALLSRLAQTVFTMERVAALAESAGRALARLEITNVIQRVGDGSTGWISNAPFDGIVVAAGAPEAPRSLLTQLRDGGRLVIPTGSRSGQTLTVIERRGEEFAPALQFPCAFVPLVGKEGWREGS
ncbi:MAG: protein-L-isoaspartate(D-aspartate) O-methyltransferase [Candidatus Eisenbacteria bacterium]|nr:protein-L-isoaspartate(D-aspartate) O-methyltransferase [Candidatus Eisenbacteria bacterium]